MLKKIKLLIAHYLPVDRQGSLLIVILLVGGILRFYNLNWDEGRFFHPDERNIALAVGRIRFFSQLNPKFFAYGSLPLYLYRFAGDLLTTLTHNPVWVNEWSKINLISRNFSALFSTISILLIFLLAKRVFDEKTGLLAALFAALAPSLIQTAHFGVTESLLVLWLLLITLLSYRMIDQPTLKNYLRVGFIFGLAVATKISALSFFIIPLTIHLLYHFKYLNRYCWLLLSLLAGLIVFSFFSPYAYLDREKFFESMRYESGVVSGRLKVVYVLQFEKTVPYLFQVKNFFWQAGPITLWGVLGAISLLFLALKTKDKKVLSALAFPLTYFFYVGSWYTKFIRYMAPILPFLILLASWFLWQIYHRKKVLGQALIAFSCLVTIFWGVAFFSIYTRISTRITASNWIYQNIPSGAKIYQEHWDDGLPITLPPNHASQYEIEQLTIYEPDNESKREYYARKLATGDYFVINSRRLYGTLIHLTEKYPLTSRYYQLLFSGALGYRKIAEFSSYPSLFGLEINDDQSEETFQVYDHPKVLIFQNQNQLTENQIAKLLQ